MNAEIVAEAALFPEEEYINGIFVAVQAAFETNFRVTGCMLSESQNTSFMKRVTG